MGLYSYNSFCCCCSIAYEWKRSTPKYESYDKAARLIKELTHLTNWLRNRWAWPNNVLQHVRKHGGPRRLSHVRWLLLMGAGCRDYSAQQKVRDTEKRQGGYARRDPCNPHARRRRSPNLREQGLFLMPCDSFPWASDTTSSAVPYTAARDKTQHPTQGWFPAFPGIKIAK